MSEKTLAQAITESPFPDFLPWWPMGDRFVSMMARSIAETWQASCDELPPDTQVQAVVGDYIDKVYDTRASPELVRTFLDAAHHMDPDTTLPVTIQSGEFDALSYAFYRLAFDRIEATGDGIEEARREFAVQVGSLFFEQLADHLKLDPPGDLSSEQNFEKLDECLAAIGHFLTRQGYLREHFAFRFDVRLATDERIIDQRAADFVAHLAQNGIGYALYEMGYPAILPSAVYLYQTKGEAQHHSSRTIEELFARCGCSARETDDFDPSQFPSDRVVELWEIET